ncbi:MAG: hypothetical protein EOO40_07465 [Deltaproteobacteria bacterium]|nr:MAG: hypothetical protein EOO40_07465 [Deltaproteobacteria bacterium]
MEVSAASLWWAQVTNRIDLIVYDMGEITCPNAPAIIPCWNEAQYWARTHLRHDYAFSIGVDPCTFEPCGTVLFTHVDDARAEERVASSSQQVGCLLLVSGKRRS